MKLMSDSRGSSATEFAAIAPVLALLALGIIDGWSLADSTLSARAAVQAAAKYFIGGGSSTSSAQSIALASWDSSPKDAAVSIVQACICENAPVACSGTICASTSMPPNQFMTISATGTWTAPFSVKFLGSQVSLNQTQVIRVR